MIKNLISDLPHHNRNLTNFSNHQEDNCSHKKTTTILYPHLLENEVTKTGTINKLLNPHLSAKLVQTWKDKRTTIIRTCNSNNNNNIHLISRRGIKLLKMKV